MQFFRNPLIRRKKLTRPFAALGFLLLAAAATASMAQDSPKPAQMKIEDRLVRLSVLVTDNSNRAVTDLRAEEFRVLEDGKPQALTYFAREELPVSYGLLIDTSGSMRIILGQIIDAGKGVVAGNKPKDETFVMRFTDSNNIQLEQGFTSNKYALEEALDNVYVEGGLTAVIDALDRSIDYLKKNRRAGTEARPRRQAIVLISDGEDRGSRARTPDALLNRLREEDVQLFIVGLSKLGNMLGSREKAASFLTRIAEATGGRAFFPKSTSEIPGVVDEISRDLRTQYTLGYVPTNPLPDGSYRKVQVSVPDSPNRKKLNVIARPGYVAPRM
jgi:Ca-activated chloride channel family protein